MSTKRFLFGFLNFYIAERITLKAVLTSFIKHLLLTLFLAQSGLLMGRIKKKQTIIQLKKSTKFYYRGSVYKNLMERYFSLNEFLSFLETKKFSTESFLTFRELQPLVSYKWVSCKKKYFYW